MKKTLLLITLIFLGQLAYSQTATVFGTITEKTTGEALQAANVIVGTRGVSADENGVYSIQIPANRTVTIIYSFTTYINDTVRVNLKANERKEVNVQLSPSNTVTVEIVDTSLDNSELDYQEVDVSAIQLIPTISLNLESVIGSFSVGTRTTNELSSQYSVRGGNFDENLVYVNDFEIYRPFLIRSGQQEGLTFPNIDLIRDIEFSAGGFDPKFGDKLSSVLNITYKRPDTTRASVGLSLLGGSAHIEGGIFQNPRNKSKNAFRYLLGARYKTTRYLLGSLDLSGEYQPNFYDIQGMLSYDFNESWQLSYIGNYNLSEYYFVPDRLVSTLGLINFALQFRVLFEGQEIDEFETYMHGVTLRHLNKDKDYFLKFQASRYGSQENERFDIIGHYELGVLETDLGSSDFGEVVSILGTGTEHSYARNFLTSTVTNVAHKGGWEWKKTEEVTQFMQWGVKYQNEVIFDKLNEWERLDSAGYSLNYDTTQVRLREAIKTEINLNSNRFSAFVQNSYNFKNDKHELSLTGGVRAQYWDLNDELIIMPRARLLYKPKSWKKDVSFKLAGGLYHQPPFYREMRNQFGDVNTNVLAQKSMHLVFGSTLDFLYQGRKFRLLGEAYYKQMWDLVAYDVDNVRIRYYGENNATGYATGLDVRLNGEFVKDAESWINISFLRTREAFNGVEHKIRTAEAPDTFSILSDVPRPTDAFFNISMFFQDYLPQNENFKVHLNITVGSGNPFGIPNNNVEYRNIYRFNGYQRVDIGFSALLWNEKWKDKRPNHPFRKFKNVWTSLEIFNLLKISNPASNTWIKTIFLQQYAVPNYLTSRRINLRFKFDF